MCGIHGMVALGGRLPGDADVLSRMGDVTRHRGPDDAGAYRDEHVALGMRRLSIIDLSSGHQPIANEDETLWVVCNGEIYNFRELRTGLKQRGHTFRTGSDVEVILHLYEEHGDRFVDHLDGMYGFALWDKRRRRLLIGRDRIGVKPLYYYQSADRLVFASESKAILATGLVDPQLDHDALREYLLVGYVPEPHSLYRGIRKLPAASLMIVENGRVDIRPYWTLPREVDESMSAERAAEAVRAELERAVASQLVSDVPLGAFLSGGLDSSTVVALMARHSDQPVRTYSIGFDSSSGGKLYNELPYARQVAAAIGTAHKEIVVRPSVARLLPRLLWHMDEPTADAAFFTTFLVADFAVRDVKVILSGVGGDEVLGGYRRYLGEHYRHRYERLPGWMRRGLIEPLARLLPSDRHSALLNLSRYAKRFLLASSLPFDERYRTFVEVFSRGERDRILRARVSREAGPHADALERAFAASPDGDALQRLFAVDFATQLVDDLLLLTDKMTMASSLECRVPLLDTRLVELCARIPARHRIRNGELKSVMKRAVTDLLPPSIIHRGKRGFGAPMGAWLKNELRPVTQRLLGREAVERRGLFDWRVVDETVRAHESARADHSDHLLALVTLELWCRLNLDRTSPADLADELASLGRSAGAFTAKDVEIVAGESR